MDYVVISDLHLGSRYCRADEFLRFLEVIPKSCPLILNGDIIDHWHRSMPETHEQALGLIRRESARREVVWIRGNNDLDYRVTGADSIRFVPEYVFDGGVLVTHGHDFDRVMHKNIVFTWPFKLIHFLRVSFGARPMHVAEYAKRWEWLYRMLRNHVVRNVVKYARDNGYSTVITGHTHHVEDVRVDGVRCLNTGAWTEEPLCCAMANGQGLALFHFSAEDGMLNRISSNESGIRR